MRLLLLCALALAAAMTSSARARAADPPPAAFDRQNATSAYPTPLAQSTQSSYVPQSVALSGPSELDYHDGESVPPGYAPVERTRKGPIIAGSIVLGTLYLFSAMAAAVNADATGRDRHDLAPMWLPALGPFLTIPAVKSTTAGFFLAVDGLGQSAGLALLIYGLTTPKTMLRRNDFVASKPTVRAVPVVSSHTAGVGLVGTF